MTKILLTMEKGNQMPGEMPSTNSRSTTKILLCGKGRPNASQLYPYSSSRSRFSSFHRHLHLTASFFLEFISWSSYLGVRSLEGKLKRSFLLVIFCYSNNGAEPPGFPAMNTFWSKQIEETFIFGVNASSASALSNPSAFSGAGGGSGRFSLISDDILLNIFWKLESDPRDWARLACVSIRFSSLVRNVCCRAKCFRSFPSHICDLGANANGSPGCWSSLLKLSVCCPGLRRAGVLLENSDFGLEREIGPDENYLRFSSSPSRPPTDMQPSSEVTTPPSLDCWSLFDDLYSDTIYDASEATTQPPSPSPSPSPSVLELNSTPITNLCESSMKAKIEWIGPVNAHLASGSWSLSREQGSKLLASNFRCDSLYVCDWPGCIHNEEKRSYMLFRGVFKDFKRSRVCKTINDSNRGKVKLDCAFCACEEAWDLHSAFCLRRAFGFHDDGEPVVRAYVCENGHVSGAWTAPPMRS